MTKFVESTRWLHQCILGIGAVLFGVLVAHWMSRDRTDLMSWKHSFYAVLPFIFSIVLFVILSPLTHRPTEELAEQHALIEAPPVINQDADAIAIRAPDALSKREALKRILAWRGIFPAIVAAFFAV